MANSKRLQALGVAVLLALQTGVAVPALAARSDNRAATPQQAREAALAGAEHANAWKAVYDGQAPALGVDAIEAGELKPVPADKWQYNAEDNVYWQVGIPYCTAEADAEYHTLGIYVPGDYVRAQANGDGTYTLKLADQVRVGMYQAKTAPIVLPVETPGYMAMKSPTGYEQAASVFAASGLVYVKAGCRGRAHGAPAGIVDLKAAIRYLHFALAEEPQDKTFTREWTKMSPSDRRKYRDLLPERTLPGDTSRIFVFGMSGGGAQAALLGATGDSKLYNNYLRDIGAAWHYSDAVAGVMAWCPITNLDVADAAYEWNMGHTRTGLTTEEAKLSQQLASAFAAYQSDLGFRYDAQALYMLPTRDGWYRGGTYPDFLAHVVAHSLDHQANDLFPPQLSDTEASDEKERRYRLRTERLTHGEHARRAAGAELTNKIERALREAEDKLRGDGKTQAIAGGAAALLRKDRGETDAVDLVTADEAQLADAYAKYKLDKAGRQNLQQRQHAQNEAQRRYAAKAAWAQKQWPGGRELVQREDGTLVLASEAENALAKPVTAKAGDRVQIPPQKDLGAMQELANELADATGLARKLTPEELDHLKRKAALLLDRPDLAPVADAALTATERERNRELEFPGWVAPKGHVHVITEHDVKAQQYVEGLSGNGVQFTYDPVYRMTTLSSYWDFVRQYKPASKGMAAFDQLDRGQGENELFGMQGKPSHFDEILASAAAGTPYADAFAADLAKQDEQGSDVTTRMNMYNPMYYVAPSYEGYGSSQVAKFWRIRTGVEQGDTALSTETNLALALMQKGAEVDFATIWGKKHVKAERGSDVNYIGNPAYHDDPNYQFIEWLNKHYLKFLEYDKMDKLMRAVAAQVEKHPDSTLGPQMKWEHRDGIARR